MKRSVLLRVLRFVLRLRPARQTAAAALEDHPPKVDVAAAPIVSSGVVVRDYEVSDQYPNAVRRPVPARELQRGRLLREVMLNVFEAQEVAVTTIYLPIDVKNGRLFINQTYEGVLNFWSPRAQIIGERYRYEVMSPVIIARKSVIIGGPIDGNYYHWMINWLSRIAILNMLRPDMFADPSIALLVDWRAKASPFIDFLKALGLGEDRLIWVDHTQDYLVRDAVLVSFGNQHVIAPAVITALRDLFAPLGKQMQTAARPRRLWISRQQLGPNRRRIHNIAEVRPLLDAYGLEEVTLEGKPIAEQIAIFQNAEFIASVHGAGLTNIIFSSPSCRVLALDSGVHIKFAAALIYETLAEACGLDYRSLRVARAPRPDGVEHNIANMHNQDLIVPVNKLAAVLEEILGPPLRPQSDA